MTVEHGTDEAVLADLVKIDGVFEASLVYGEYDIHCRIEVDNLDHLRDIVAQIRKLSLLTTETLIAYERTPKRIKRLTDRRIMRHWRERTHRADD
jgi:DNA-binding Lrp family transcriptional regulator